MVKSNRYRHHQITKGLIEIMDNTDRFIYSAIAVILILRLIALWVTPLGLGVDEAQYWFWGTSIEGGYFTKPPMIAWLIRLGTEIFGDSTFGVRALSPIMHAITTLLMMRLGTIAFSPKAGQLAAIIWMSIPAASLGGFVISTDTPMIMFMMAALIMLAPLAKGQPITLSATLIAGLLSGLAMLSKYAGIYLLAGLLLWWLWQGRHFKGVRLKHLILYLVGFIIPLVPNIIWNLNNGFATVLHLVYNADVAEPHYNLLGSLEFFLSQAVIVGPIILALTLFVMARQITNSESRFWIALFIPAITTITIQAYLSNANTNWAVASWPSAILLTAGVVSVSGSILKRLTFIGVGVNGVMIAAGLAVSMVGSLGAFAPDDDPIAQVRGWPNHALEVRKFAQDNSADTIITVRRGAITRLFWELRHDDFTIELIDGNGIAGNHFEYSHPWVPIQNRRVVLMTESPTPPETPAITWLEPRGGSSEQISRSQERQLFFYLGVEN